MNQINHIVCRMTAIVPLRIGAKVIVNMRSRGDDWESHVFYNKYNHKKATIAGFVVEHVGPLDSQGRPPGVYPKDERVLIEFEDGTRQELWTHMLRLADSVSTLAADDYRGVASPQPFPCPILFYPGDHVRKEADPSEEVRLVQHVGIRGDKSCYHLAESAEMKRLREDAGAKAKAAGTLTLGTIFERPEYSDGDGLILVSRGNVYHLYNSPEKLRFESDEEELAFWAQSGVSQHVSRGEGRNRRMEWPLGDALTACEKGDADLITRIPEEYLKCMLDLQGEYHVHRLHDCFVEHRERVRAVAGRVKTLPSAEDLKLSSQERARRIVGIN